MMAHLPQDEAKIRELMGLALVIVFTAIKEGGPIFHIAQVEKLIDAQCGGNAELRTMAYSVLASVTMTAIQSPEVAP